MLVELRAYVQVVIVPPNLYPGLKAVRDRVQRCVSVPRYIDLERNEGKGKRGRASEKTVMVGENGGEQ